MFNAKKKKKTKVKPTATQDYLPPTSFGTDEVRFTTSEESVNQPKRTVPNKKEEMIKKGMLIRQKNEYPTMDDVASDWEDSAESKLNPTKGTGSSLMVKKGDKKATASKKKKEGTFLVIITGASMSTIKVIILIRMDPSFSYT